MNQSPVSPRKVLVVCVMMLIVLFGGISIFKMFEHLDATHLMVIQFPRGELEVYTEPGIYVQWYGLVTKYPKRAQVWFSARSDQGKKADDALPIRFNDKGKATMSVGISWTMPLIKAQVLKLHTNFGSTDAIEKQLVETVVQKAVYAVGPLMSSQESAAERRNDLFQYFEDQIQNGVYKTETVQEKQKDQMSGAERSVSVVKLITDKEGKPLRADDSPLLEFGIKTFNPVINAIKYDDTVEKQIQDQQKAIMEVQTSMAEAKKAEQRTITAEQEGKAKAATAKWEQEVIKVQQVTEAQQKLEVATLEAKARLDVARLDAQAAEQFKLAETLKGEGEAARRRLVMEADGALEKKLLAYVQVSQNYATAIQNYKGNWVPNVVMGGGNGNHATGSGAQELIDLLTAKTARELGLSLNIPTATGEQKPN